MKALEQIEVPKRLKIGLMNVKGVLGKLGRKASAARSAEEPAVVTTLPSVAPITQSVELECLEEANDDCLTAVRALDREGLAEVIGLLRTARNRVVWKVGE
jgi:hypothetical protein